MHKITLKYFIEGECIHMKRKITSKVYELKNMLNARMFLLIYGARQDRKIFEGREFGALY